MWCAPPSPSSGSRLSDPVDRQDRLNLLLSHAGWRPESWPDSLPRLLEPMGVRAWRVDTGRAASRLLEAEPIHIAVVDLSLPLEEQTASAESGSPRAPAEGGPRLLELLARQADPPPTIVIKRPKTRRDDARELAQALRLGAFAVVDRPVDLELMLEVFRRVLRRFYRDRWPSE